MTFSCLQAACHKDRHVSKRAIDIIHDVLTEVMMTSQELPHFNFHEALLKPFESLLRLELCDSDVQDQVIAVHLHLPLSTRMY